MLVGELLGAVLRQAPLSSFVGFAARLVPAQYYTDPLSCEGSRRKHGRYHRTDGVATLYLSDTLVTALHEKRYLVDTGNETRVLPMKPQHAVSVMCQFARLVDVTNLQIQQMLGTSLQELTGAWGTYGDRIAPTQTLAAVAHQIGAQGLKVPSAPYSQGFNLVMFCDRIEGAVSVYTG